VQLGVDRTGGLGRHPRDALELFLRSGEETLGRAKVLEQSPAACRPDPGQRVEDRLPRLRVTPLAVEAERESMGFVPNTLEQL
jgi:hypothetical protein